MNSSVNSPGGNATLFETVLPSRAGQVEWIRIGLVAIVGTVLLTLSAKFEIPFWPVPVTLQSLVVMSLGLVLGARMAAATVATYLVVGAFGLPVFAGTPEKGIGLAYMVGPTGGYLAGFVAAAFVVGWLAERRWDRSVVGTVGAMLIGTVVLYALGLAWLGMVLGWDKPILEWGLYPFVLGDLAKVVIAAALLPTLWRLLGKR